MDPLIMPMLVDSTLLGRLITSRPLAVRPLVVRLLVIHPSILLVTHLHTARIGTIWLRTVFNDQPLEHMITIL